MARTPRPLITSEEVAALTPEWAALHAATPGAPPFAHPAWHATWLRHFGGNGDPTPVPLYLAVRLEDALIGVVPVDAATARLRILGDPEVCDYAGVLVATGHERAVASAVLEWLMEDMTPTFAVWGMPAGTALAAAFAQAADTWGWSCSAIEETVAPIAALPDSFEAFVAGLGKHDRHELRRKLRNLEAAGAVTIDTAAEPEAALAGMERLFALMHASHREKDAFLTPAMEAFFRDLAGTFCALGMTRLQTLRLDGTPIASVFVFDTGGTRYLYNSGYDPAYAPQAAGLLSKALSIRDAIEQGLRSFDFLHGTEQYKTHLGGVARPIVTLHLRQGPG